MSSPSSATASPSRRRRRAASDRPAPVRGAAAGCRWQSVEDVAARVVALVAEQTGYPPELLDLDLDLEADLGFDTVKQAELFAQVRESYGIARDDSLKLRDYPTLNHVVAFVRDRIPQPEATASPAPCEPAPVVAAPPPVGAPARRPRLPPSDAGADRSGRRWTTSRRPASGWTAAPGSSSCRTPAAWPRRCRRS